MQHGSRVQLRVVNVQKRQHRLTQLQLNFRPLPCLPPRAEEWSGARGLTRRRGRIYKLLPARRRDDATGGSKDLRLYGPCPIGGRLSTSRHPSPLTHSITHCSVLQPSSGIRRRQRWSRARSGGCRNYKFNLIEIARAAPKETRGTDQIFHNSADSTGADG